MQLDIEDSYSLHEIYQVQNQKDTFFVRIENSPNTHMLVVWNDEKKLEEVSADVDYLSKLMFDN